MLGIHGMGARRKGMGHVACDYCEESSELQAMGSTGRAETAFALCLLFEF
jgi:hypothetical protein